MKCFHSLKSHCPVAVTQKKRKPHSKMIYIILLFPSTCRDLFIQLPDSVTDRWTPVVASREACHSALESNCFFFLVLNPGKKKRERGHN